MPPDTSPMLKLLDSGFYLLSWNREQWAQWPSGRDPGPDDCFHPDDTWPLVREWLRHRDAAEEEES